MATESSVVQPQILVLSERNYDTWFINMRNILHGLLSVESSKKDWDTLETCYQGVTKVKNVKV